MAPSSYKQMTPVSGDSRISPELNVHSAMSGIFSIFPRSDSMDATNDPRFFSDSVISKRLAAFQAVTVVATLMVTLSVKQMFLLQKNIDLETTHGVLQYMGFCLMVCVFLLNLTAVVVLVQQLFQTYRLMTVGPTGFEIAKSYYLNPNIVTMRHIAVKGFFFSLPLFVASSSCMVWVNFDSSGTTQLAIPIVIFLVIMACLLCTVNGKHQSIFKTRYSMAKVHEEPLLTHVAQTSQRSNGMFAGIDV
eukprot:CAMPEP_0115190438 /NCGR_PEP_ID=MMETSP0270-20121206/12025_1 /TAXON_ID=71861 /ORGANISM="Scrippsiella trochoidea, Strain CCMP3099" /LENGTH=246 /DNA_ID=CAMNT_0002603649 /DNA_START=65 /DNA_END=805 /DNA_ORIENTATION=+